MLIKRDVLLLSLFCILLFCGISVAETLPGSILLGREDKSAYPWGFKDKDNKVKGLNIIFLRILEKKIGVKIQIKEFPWIRALVTMESGKIDGVFAASYKQEREVYGVYPNIDGVPDPSKRIHTSGYSLYISRNSHINFNGLEFTDQSNPNKVITIGVQRAFSIIDSLTGFNVKLNDSYSDPGHILLLLAHGRISAAAIQTPRADNIVSSNKEIRENISKHNTRIKPFHQKPYYIMLSHQFVEKFPEFSGFFWDNVEEVRNSEEYKTKAMGFYQKNY